MRTKSTPETDLKLQGSQLLISHMIGDPERVQAFQASLRQQVRLGRGNLEAQQNIRPGWVHLGAKTNPYEAVFKSISQQFEAARKHYVPYYSFGSSQTSQEAVHAAEGNGLAGLTVAMMALNGLGEVYANHAVVPQARSGVASSIGRVLRTVQLIALNDGKTARRHVRAMMAGTNPKRRLLTAIRGRNLQPGVDATATANEHSFLIKDNEGQLLISPRYTPLKSSGDGVGCPARAVRIEGEGRTLPGLHTLLHAVGEVVLDEVYPHQFDIDYDS